jgi:hypothetical protein
MTSGQETLAERGDRLQPVRALWSFVVEYLRYCRQLQIEIRMMEDIDPDEWCSREAW